MVYFLKMYQCVILMHLINSLLHIDPFKLNQILCYHYFCTPPTPTTAQISSTEPEVRFWAGSNPAHFLLKVKILLASTHHIWEVCDGENLRQCYRQEINLDEFSRPTIAQNQFINLSRHQYFMVSDPTKFEGKVLAPQ